MKLHEISLVNFRNYKELNVKFTGNVHFFVGDNAQGKTNLLEAIYVMAITKSHRTSKDDELIKWGEENALIKCILNFYNREHQLQMVINQHKKKTYINGVELSKISEFVGQLRAVLFAPEDLLLVKGSPSLRRKFMDRTLGQTKKKYMYELTIYQKILKHRNTLLKKIQKKECNDGYLQIWDEQLIKSGQVIIDERKKFINDITNYAKNIHKKITNNKEQLAINYVADVNQENFLEKMQINKNKDIMTGTTNSGPHRDDIDMFINERDVKLYGSQGQQRTTALSLKMAELKYMQEQTGDTPLLLLDDVMSELDKTRQNYLLDAIGNNVQTFITATNTDNINHTFLQNAQMFNIDKGQVSEL